MLLLILSLISASFAEKPSEPSSQTAAEICQYGGYAYANEKFGPHKGIEFSFQNASCNGGGHARFVVSIVARDAKSKKQITSVDDEWMDDGISLAPVMYSNGVFVYTRGIGGESVVTRFDHGSREFKDVSFAEEKQMPNKPPAKVRKRERESSSPFVRTLQDLKRQVESNCRYEGRLGSVVDMAPAEVAATAFESASKTADSLYKSGKKAEAARLVLQYLGSVEMDEALTIACRMGGCAGEEADTSNPSKLSEVEKRTVAKLRFFKSNPTEVSEAPAFSYVTEWNNLGFYLAQAGYAKPAITVLTWVREADPDRKVAEKNLNDAKALKSEKPIVFDLNKFEVKQDATIKNLEAFYAEGGQPVWHDDSIESAKVLKSFKAGDSRHVYSTKACAKNETQFDTLLHLALATGQTKTADWLWNHGFNDDIIDEAGLWLAAAQRKQLASARWLIDHKIGIGDDDSLLALLTADDVEIYKQWASVSPDARNQTDRFIYRYEIPPKIFDHLFKKKTIALTYADDDHPTLLSLLADSSSQIENVTEKLKQIIAAGISPNILNRSGRLSALDYAVSKRTRNNVSRLNDIAKALRALGAKTGKELLAEGQHPKFTDTDFSPNAVAAFKKAAQPGQ